MKKLLFFSVIAVIIVSSIWYFDKTPPLTTTCIFCTATINNQVFYDDGLVRCLFSYKPVYPGHSLIIPKRHVERFEDLTQQEITGMMAIIKKVHAAHQRLYGACSYFLLQKNGREVGQTVPHVHFHYIPRRLGNYSQLSIFWHMILAAHLKPALSRELLNQEALTMRGALAAS